MSSVARRLVEIFIAVATLTAALGATPARAQGDGERGVSRQPMIELGEAGLFQYELSTRPEAGQVSPLVGGGFDWGSAYVKLNQVDQGALLAGAGAGVAAALCSISKVGWADCGAVALVVAVATYYLNAGRKCPDARPNLKVCVPSSIVAGCVR